MGDIKRHFHDEICNSTPEAQEFLEEQKQLIVQTYEELPKLDLLEMFLGWMAPEQIIEVADGIRAAQAEDQPPVGQSKGS